MLSVCVVLREQMRVVHWWGHLGEDVFGESCNLFMDVHEECVTRLALHLLDGVMGNTL